MTYSETVSYLYESLPMFHRIGPAAYKANLDNIHALSELLGHPENKFRTIHIAGTNGKGSVSNMLASVLSASGYKTGLFTSPHLKDFRERVRINGMMIGENDVISFVVSHKKEFEKIAPSFFEWTTALAFDFFAREKVDVAVIETGLGGRLDSTNIISPLLSVITNISNDHKNLLGDTLQKIAIEKAGIIKKDIPVVIGERQNELEKVFIEKAKESNSKIYFASDHFTAEIIEADNFSQHFLIRKDGVEVYKDLRTDLPGAYQQKNICTVLQSIELLKKEFTKIDDQKIMKGISGIRQSTGMSGRWQVLGDSPLIIADVAHNEEGIRSVVHQLSGLSFDQLHIVIGMVNDKDIAGVLSLLPDYAIYYFCKADIPRSFDETSLMNEAAKLNLFGQSFATVKAAVEAAIENAHEDDVIFIGGSTFVVAEAI